MPFTPLLLQKDDMSAHLSLSLLFTAGLEILSTHASCIYIIVNL